MTWFNSSRHSFRCSVLVHFPVSLNLQLSRPHLSLIPCMLSTPWFEIYSDSVLSVLWPIDLKSVLTFKFAPCSVLNVFRGHFLTCQCQIYLRANKKSLRYTEWIPYNTRTRSHWFFPAYYGDIVYGQDQPG